MPQILDLEEELLSILAPGWSLSQYFPKYEVREEQQKMLLDVLRAYQEKGIALIEAGTGTGKSLAYLLPAVVWALQSGTKTVIATKTIHLQEQLIHHDIPLVEKVLGKEFKSALVKGMGNYICLRRLGEVALERALFSSLEAAEFEKIEAWADETRDGSLSDLPFSPKRAIWEKVQAESDSCTRRKCPYYQNCAFIQARKQAADSHVIVANHHLLLNDLSLRSELDSFDDEAILPPYDHVILDEAHHLEDVATECFANRIGRGGVGKVLSRLCAERGGKVQTLARMLSQHLGKDEEGQSALSALKIQIPRLYREILIASEEFFSACVNFVKEHMNRAEQELKLRLLLVHYQSRTWQNEVLPLLQQLVSTVHQLNSLLTRTVKEIKLLLEESFLEKTVALRQEILALSTRLSTYAEALELFSDHEKLGERVRWMELKRRDHFESVDLIDADLLVAKHLRNALFERFHSVILCSATMTTNRSFSYIRGRLGVEVEDRAVTESIYHSPFNYAQQAKLLLLNDLPLPSHPQYNDQAFSAVLKAIKASRGGAFVLFTSYAMMRSCKEKLKKNLDSLGYPLLVHGEEQRSLLIERFKEHHQSVLFGTDSFWEGVDVAGRALRLVIIAKLPFQVPSEPLFQARSEAVEGEGGHPFMDYSLPEAIVKYKQGVGRLIRSRKDRGCVVSLDPRVVKKGYGKQFMKSLPPFTQVEVGVEGMEHGIRSFFGEGNR